MVFKILFGNQDKYKDPMCIGWKLVVDDKNILFMKEKDSWYYSDVDLEIGGWIWSIPEIISGEKCKIDFIESPQTITFQQLNDKVYIEIEVNIPKYTKVEGKIVMNGITHVNKVTVLLDDFIKELLRVGEIILSIAKESKSGNKFTSGYLYIEEALNRAKSTLKQ